MRALAMFGLALFLSACHPKGEKTARELSGGDPERGRQLVASYGCGACHQVPGIDGATGLIGPPLGNIAERTVLAGRLPNTPDNMIRWIREPQKVKSGTAMLNLNVTEHDARDITAFLYELRN
jgi:cytochrome c